MNTIMMLYAMTVLHCLANHVEVGSVNYAFVETKLGNVRGIINSYGNMTVSEFVGIRYAQPPTGNLRFSKPFPVLPWKPATYNATALGNWCPQGVPGQFRQEKSKPISEDCLFLNIYVPCNNQAAAPAYPKAVMIYVHGGGFNIGSSSQFTGVGLASVGDVVVVTINYRLNVFGFLSTGDANSLGNYGLWDQRQAFLWVKDNIGAFGGDITRVTIFGQSAGAASVNYQAITPQNDQNIFQRIIVESGSFHSPWAFQYDAADAATTIGQRVACPSNESSALVACLRSKTATELLAYAEGLGWEPVTDGEFLIDNPMVMTQKVLNGSRDSYLLNFAKYDYLVGFNSQEALMFVDKPWTTKSINDVSKKLTGKDISNGITGTVYEYALTLIGEFLFTSSSDVSWFTNAVQQLYENIYRDQITIPPGDKDRLKLFVQINGDFELVTSVLQTVKLHALLNGTGKSYLYEYDVKRSFDEPRNIFWEGPDWLRLGADHADELNSVLAYPYLQGLLPNDTLVHNFTYSAEEKVLSKNVITYWSNYATNGDPNQGQPLNPGWSSWSPYTNTTRHYLHIKINDSTPYYDAKHEEDNFWNTIVPGRNFHP